MGRPPAKISKLQSDDPVLNRLQDQYAQILNPVLSNPALAMADWRFAEGPYPTTTSSIQLQIQHRVPTSTDADNWITVGTVDSTGTFTAVGGGGGGGPDIDDFIPLSFAQVGALIVGSAPGVPANLYTTYNGQPLVADPNNSNGVGMRWGLSDIERRVGRATTKLDPASANFAVSGALSTPTFSGTAAWAFPLGGTGALVPWWTFTTAAGPTSTAGLIGSAPDAKGTTQPILRVVNNFEGAGRIWIGLTSADLSSHAPPAPGAAVASGIEVMALANDPAVSAHWLIVSGDGSNWSSTDTGLSGVHNAAPTNPLALYFDSVSVNVEFGGLSFTKSTNVPASSTDLKVQACITGSSVTLYISTYGLEQN